MKNVYAYPVVLKPFEKGKGYLVRIPDFDIETEGKSIEDAIYMARDAIGLMGITYEDENKTIPLPNSVKFKQSKNVICTYVDVDFVQYRKKNDRRKVRKNCTISYSLCLEGEKRGINFSELLQNALIEALAE